MMNVMKRSGRLAKLDCSNITKQTIPACKDLDGVAYEELELSSNIQFVDGMKSTDIQEILISTAKSKVDIDTPNWTFVAARLRLYDMYHNIQKLYKVKDKKDVYKAVTLTKYLDKNKDKLDINIDLFDLNRLEEVIDSKRDLLFNAIGIETLILRYLIRDANKNITELPQHLFMGLAMWLATNEDDATNAAIKFYNALSTLKVVMATPTLSKGRLKNQNHSSCFVGSAEDSLEGILEAYSDFSQGSKRGGGWGYDWTRIRALGGQIDGNKSVGGGLIPWMKVQNSLSNAVDQLGSRPGSETASIENWHLDVYDFIDLRKTSGEERRRAEDLFLALSVSDLFMERIEQNSYWTLFDPYDVQELPDLFGKAFKTKYIEYEDLSVSCPELFTNPPKRIQAKELWAKMISSYFDVGMPFIFFKDNVNNAHKHKELGVIRSSNLCMEVAQPTDEHNTVVCNLGSLNFARVTEDEVYKYTSILYKMLDNVIDLSTYPTEKARQTQLSRRAIGCGFMGMAEAIANKEIMYGSKEHIKWIETNLSQYRRAIEDTNILLGRAKGSYKLYDGVGYRRNAYTTAVAPTASISLIAGTTAAHEPVFGYKWSEDGLLGQTTVTAPHLTADNYRYYINAYDVDQKDYIDIVAKLQEYVDQSISHNIYFRPENVTAGKIADVIKYAHKKGVKTLYYLRSKSQKVQESLSDTVSCVGCQ